MFRLLYRLVNRDRQEEMSIFFPNRKEKKIKLLTPIVLLLLLVMSACESSETHLELALFIKQDRQILRVTNRDIVAVRWRTSCCETPPHGYEVKTENGQWKYSFCGVSGMALSQGCCTGNTISTLQPGQSVEILRWSTPRGCEGKTIRALLYYSVVGEKGEKVAKSPPISFKPANKSRERTADAELIE